MKKLLYTLLFTWCWLNALSQGTVYPLTFGNNTFHHLDRFEIKTGLSTGYHPSLRNFNRAQVTSFALFVDSTAQQLSTVDRFNLQTIFDDNNEWLVQSPFPSRLTGPKEKVNSNTEEVSPALLSINSPKYTKSQKTFLKHFYKTPANFFQVESPYFNLRAYPIFNLELGTLQEEEDPYYFNRRGFELRGGIDDRIYFSFNLFETQAHFPNYVAAYRNRFNAIPGEGFIKSYENSILGFEDGNDFLNGQGVMGFNFSKHAGMQFGYGRNFIGNGYRSLFLSDFSNNYTFLKLNWQVWKFHYQNIFGELSANSLGGPDLLIPKKYFAAHYLTLKLNDQISIGVFETVVFSRLNQFELQYLNPIMFYRTIEQSLGSPDNVLFGFDAKWNFLKQFQLYGQILFDEIKIDELTAGDGWWANKFGIQAGLKYIDAFNIPNLDLQFETNTVRPYTYTHFTDFAGYTHYNQPLAHPLGANFSELLFLVRYQPFNRLTVNGQIFLMNVGEDNNGTNWGSNLLISSDSREQEYNNEIGQGIGAQINTLGIDVSYQLGHNIFFDFFYFSRRKDSDEETLDLNTTQLGGGIRINVARKQFDF